MEKKKVKDLAKGEYFILNPIEEPNASQVWVRGEYIREAKKYSTYKWEDTNHETLRKGDKEVYIGFHLLITTTMAQQKGYLPPEAKEAFEENGIPF